jgi:hypothetical protein
MDVTTFANQIHDCPMSLPDLKIFNSECREFGPAQPTAYEHGNHCEITKAAQIVAIGFLQQKPSLILGQPVPGARAKLFCAFDPANSCSELRAEQSGVCGFIGQSPDCRKPLIDGSGCQAERFQVKAKSQDHSPIQCKSRFGTVPSDELLHRKLVIPSRMRRAETVEYRGFRVIQIR